MKKKECHSPRCPS